MHVTICLVSETETAYLSITDRGDRREYPLTGESRALAASWEPGYLAPLSDRLDEAPWEATGATPEYVALIAADLRAQYFREMELAPPLESA